jgi:pyridoxamine 5'-phosphate oxidase family protein
MAGRSKKSIADVLRPPMQLELSPKNDADFLLEKKITIATEGFTTSKFCELILRDRNRISKENALTVGLRLVYHIIIVK